MVEAALPLPDLVFLSLRLGSWGVTGPPRLSGFFFVADLAGAGRGEVEASSRRAFRDFFPPDGFPPAAVPPPVLGVAFPVFLPAFFWLLACLAASFWNLV
jgi:hypothetical protein